MIIGYGAQVHRFQSTSLKVTWGIASPVEYDVPKCAEGVMGCSMENGTWTPAAVWPLL